MLRDLQVLAARPVLPEESGVESVTAGTAHRHLATNIRGPEDDNPRKNGRTRVETRVLEKHSLVQVSDETFEVVRRPTAVYGRMHKGADNLFIKTLTTGHRSVTPCW